MSSRSDLKYRMSLPASQAAVNSASVLEWAMVSWNLVLQPTAPPAYMMIMPVMDFRCVVSEAQSASTYPYRVGLASAGLTSREYDVIAISSVYYSRDIGVKSLALF
jgi:hypothetical protein